MAYLHLTSLYLHPPVVMYHKFRQIQGDRNLLERPSCNGLGLQEISLLYIFELLFHKRRSSSCLPGSRGSTRSSSMMRFIAERMFLLIVSKDIGTLPYPGRVIAWTLFSP